VKKDYEPVTLTPKLRAEMEAIVAQQVSDHNLALAVSAIVDATRKPAMTLPRETIVRQVGRMDATRLRAELLLMIDSFNEITRAAASMVVVAANQRMVARSETGKKASSASRVQNKKVSAMEISLRRCWMSTPSSTTCAGSRMP